MANLTIAVDDEILRRARLRALEGGTSVNALLRGYLESYVGDERMDKRREIVQVANDLAADFGSRDWVRADLHEH